MAITQYLRIPQDRIGVLIGHNGAVKDELERLSASKISVDSEEGVVCIEGVEGEDPTKTLRVVDVVRAIGRGFSPERAIALLEDDSLIFDVISLAHLSPKALKRMKGRIIGQKGKTRRVIETLTGVKMSVYGKTVSLIGYPEQLKEAREAIEMLLRGTPHSTVYAFLERKRPALEPEW